MALGALLSGWCSVTNWLARYATRVVVRRLILLVLAAFLAWVGIGRAEAYEQCVSVSAGCTIEQAYQRAVWEAQKDANFCAITSTQNVPQSGGGVIRAHYTRRQFVGNPACSGTGTGHGYYSQGCPAGSNWDSATGTCATECGDGAWPDPTKPGECLNEQKCLAKPNLGASSVASGGFTTCNAGCSFEPLSAVSVSFGGNDPFSYGGAWAPTGEACSAGAPAPEPIPPEGVCSPLGNGQTACKRPDGKICHTTPSGKQFCWNSGEVGEKTDGPDLQKTNPGPDAIPPNSVLPSGDSLIPEGTPVTTTETTKDGRTTSTTTHSYTTQHGTNAGTGKGQAEGGGSGGTGTGDGEGDGDDEKGKVTGGQTCDAPPTITGGDPLVAAQLQQQWMLRCGDGTDPNPGEGEYLGNGEGEPEAGSVIRKFEGEPDLDMSGFGYARSCPAVPTINVMGKSVSFDTSVFCDWMHLGGWFVVLIAGLACARHILEA